MVMVTAAQRPVDGTFRVGTDIVELGRFRALVLRHGTTFLARLFTRAEVEVAERHAIDVVAALAGCLAVKKAVIAAMRPTERIPLTDIECEWGHSDWASVALRGECHRFAVTQDVTVADIATARTGSVATATAIVRSGLLPMGVERVTPFDTRAIGRA